MDNKKTIKHRIMKNNLRLVELITIKTYEGSTPEIELEIKQLSDTIAKDKLLLAQF